MIKIKLNIKSDFVKNVFTLLSGATIAQVIALITIPVLTRLYTPEDFGYIAIYLSITNIIAAVSSGRYELAIMLPKKKEDALAIFKGIIRWVAIISIIAFVLMVIVKKSNHKIADFVQPNYFYFLPLSVFTVALSNAYLQWYTRVKKFKLQANAKIVKSAASSGVNIGLGHFFQIKSLGLFFGHIAGQASQFILFVIRFIKEEKKNLKFIDREKVKQQLKENRNFPYFSAPMAFLNAISVDVLIYVLNLFYSTSLVGFYSNANKVINYPLSLISQSFTSVFYQKMTETNKKMKLYLISYFSNFGIATLAMLPIIFWGEEIFSFVLGNEWSIAGSIAKYLSPLTIASFAMRSVSNIFSLTRRNGTLLIWQILYLTITFIIIFYTKSGQFEQMIWYVSLIGSILYIILAVIGFFIIRKKEAYEKTK